VLAGPARAALSDGLVVHWKLDVDEDPQTDSSGNGHTGAVTGATWIAGGQIDGALSFDGVDDTVVATGYTGILGTNPRTCSAWIKTSDDDASILWWGTSAAGQRWVFRVTDGGVMRIEVGGGNVVGTAVVTDNTWHHVAAVWSDDGSPDVGDTLLYVDGAPDTKSSTNVVG